MSNTPVIRAEHLGKRYVLGARQRNTGTARDAIAGAMNGLFRRLRPSRRRSDPAQILWALDDVSFEVQPGETVGIVGRNGAGKSTLLKILSQITEPTTGFAEVTGRVGSLLEVGTGFHADLTGRENTYLNGAILGMKRAEIDRKFDEIVAFAEVDRFIDTPVKFYSSGMYMRLAFAVAAHLETEILVVDEVLAVGDVQFQQKCLGQDGRHREARPDGAVHQPQHGGHPAPLHEGDAARSRPPCRERLDSRSGREVPSDRAAAGGRRTIQPARPQRHRLGAREGHAARSIEAAPPLPGVPAEDDLEFTNRSRTRQRLKGGRQPPRASSFELTILSDQGQPLVSLMNVDDGGVALPSTRSCRITARIEGPTFLPGRYRVNAFLGIPHLEHVDEIPDALEFEVLPPVHPWRPYELSMSRQIVCRKAAWTCYGDRAPRLEQLYDDLSGRQSPRETDSRTRARA